jgi:glutaredoxin 3
MKKVIMYSTKTCPYCQSAERLLKSRGVAHIEKILIDEHPEQREQMTQRTGLKTVPQIFIGEDHIGGYDKLAELDRKGQLTKLLEPN